MNFLDWWEDNKEPGIDIECEKQFNAAWKAWHARNALIRDLSTANFLITEKLSEADNELREFGINKKISRHKI